mmetsp:Transcript_50738/g.122375  ORF Transcript_50738/g.122375 Transcript_50738/m.122375 type:complete len:275 (+) Transcript_50738:230-1054(+)
MRACYSFFLSVSVLLLSATFIDSFISIGSTIINQQLNVPAEDRDPLHRKQSRNQRNVGRHVKLLFGQSDESESSPSSWFSSQSIRFLGKGPDAIVRPGAVLLAPAEQQDHFLRQAAVFVIDMGESDTGDYLIRAVVLDNPTPFTMGEMMPTKRSGGIYDNLIFRGGDTGSKDEAEGCFCIHSFPELGRDEIGTTGIYQGGDLNQMTDTNNVKFFFNYMEFTEQELEQLLEIGHEAGDGDGWTSVEVPKEIVLSSDYDRGDAWSRLRNAVRDQTR